MAYTAPPTQVAYEEDPALAKLLLTSPDYIRVCNNSHFVAHQPRPWRDRFTGISGDGLAFSHERTAPAGAHRLVVVQLWLAGSMPVPPRQFRQILLLNEYVILPGSFGPAPELAQKASLQIEELSALAPSDRLRFYAGQPDPTDSSHFTIGYAVNGQPGTIDGWLGDDERVKLVVRDGPAKKP